MRGIKGMRVRIAEFLGAHERASGAANRMLGLRESPGRKESLSIWQKDDLDGLEAFLRTKPGGTKGAKAAGRAAAGASISFVSTHCEPPGPRARRAASRPVVVAFPADCVSGKAWGCRTEAPSSRLDLWSQGLGAARLEGAPGLCSRKGKQGRLGCDRLNAPAPNRRGRTSNAPLLLRPKRGSVGGIEACSLWCPLPFWQIIE